MKRTLALMALCAVMALVSACAHTPPVVVEKPVVTYVEKRIECPSAQERARLKSLRPTPLREQPMPSDTMTRSGQSEAQLGKYEAEGGWADQVDEALDRCQK